MRCAALAMEFAGLCAMNSVERPGGYEAVRCAVLAMELSGCAQRTVLRGRMVTAPFCLLRRL